MDDVITLARLQFGITAIAHYLFVSLTLGLVTFVVVMQTRWALTGKEEHRRQTRFWGQLYVINYVLGIGTGLVMEFQFGLTWSGLTHFVGNVFGAPLAVETLVAFFAESTLLGLWIFGWDRLGRRLHTLMIWLVALTAYASVFFVLSANGFLQHPVGERTEDGKIYLESFTALLTNSNALAAGVHVLSASLVTGAFFIIAVSAWHLRRGTGHDEFYWSSLRLTLPAAPLLVLATTGLGALQLGYSTDQTPTKYGPGLDEAVDKAREFSEQFGPGVYYPPSFVGIFEYAMVIPAAFMILITLAGALMMIKRRLLRSRMTLWLLTAALVLPYVSNISGWIFREVGRQPWAVYGLLKTEDAISPRLTAGSVLFSLILFGILVTALTLVDWALLVRFARRGPDGAQLGYLPGESEPAEPGTPGGGRHTQDAQRAKDEQRDAKGETEAEDRESAPVF
ncbi:cytochrome ubiquinol oxidase subunit I [Streptomyces paradoxus]|uniref:cytochrome ubiquinol oxidase subunit I n=1 Tax=Streptomyces paradoxus TaxID=66375 RepID=UPI003640C309